MSSLQISPYIIPPELNIKLIGIHGKAHVGKSTFAQTLMSVQEPVMTYAFASPLKYSCAAAFGMDTDDFYDTEKKEKINEFWSISPREVAQFVGTEFFRDQIDKVLREKVGEDFWVKRLYGILTQRINDSSGMLFDHSSYTIIIEDVRFQNEVNFITANNGYHVEITRPSEGDSYRVGIPGHKSEVGSLNFPFEKHYFFPNVGNKETFIGQAKDFAVQLGLTPF